MKLVQPKMSAALDLYVQKIMFKLFKYSQLTLKAVYYWLTS